MISTITTAQHRLEPIGGTLICSGTVSVDGAPRTGLFISCPCAQPCAQVQKAPSIPLNQPVVVLDLRDWLAIQRREGFLIGALEGLAAGADPELRARLEGVIRRAGEISP